jgi:hypothetical protein
MPMQDAATKLRKQADEGRVKTDRITSQISQLDTQIAVLQVPCPQAWAGCPAGGGGECLACGVLACLLSAWVWQAATGDWQGEGGDLCFCIICTWRVCCPQAEKEQLDAELAEVVSKEEEIGVVRGCWPQPRHLRDA